MNPPASNSDTLARARPDVLCFKSRSQQILRSVDARRSRDCVSYNSSKFLYGPIYVRLAVQFDKAVAAKVKSTLAAIADEVVK